MAPQRQAPHLRRLWQVGSLGPPWSIYGSIEDQEGKYRGYTVVGPPQNEKMVTCCSDDCREQAQATPIPGKHVIPKDVQWIK